MSVILDIINRVIRPSVCRVFGRKTAKRTSESSNMAVLPQDLYTPFLLEAGKAIAASLDLSQVLQKIIESVTLAVNADHAVIAVADDPGGEHMTIIAGYDPLHRQVWQASGVHFSVNNYPAIQHAVRRRQQTLLQDVESKGDLVALHDRTRRRDLAGATG